MDGYEMDMSQEKELRVKKLLPAGWREFEIVDCVPETSKKGNDMFIFDLRDIETEYIDPLYAISTPGKRWLLKSILGACGVEAAEDGKYKWNFESVMNKRVLGFVEHEPNVYINREGQEIHSQQHKITKFKKVSEQKPTELNVENSDGVETPEDIKWSE